MSQLQETRAHRAAETPGPITRTRPVGESAPIHNEPELRQMDLGMLIRCCTVESERFYRGQPSDTRYSYELFRRALVERNEAAWAQLYYHYHGLVESWVRRCSAFARSGESSDYFVSGAFTKFWRAVTPERFASFESVARLLHYLQLCTTSVVIDSVRAQSWAEMLPEETTAHGVVPQYAPDEEALQQVDREEFWRFIDTQLNGVTERTVIYDSFVLGLAPRAIYARHERLFGSVNEVYSIKRNVLGRLGRSAQLREMVGM